MPTRAQLHSQRPFLAFGPPGGLLQLRLSPALAEFGHFLTVALRDALPSDPHPAAVQRYLELAPHDLDLLGRSRRCRPTNGQPHSAYDEAAHRGRTP